MKTDVLVDFGNQVASRFGIDYFFGQPADTITFWFLLAGFLGFLLFIIIYSLVLRSRAKAAKPYASYGKTFFWFNFSVIILALVHLFGRYENLAFFSWRIWMYFSLAVLIAFNGWFFSKRKQQLEDELERVADTNRKQKWLKPSKRKKK